jgi:hypothetical protein
MGYRLLQPIENPRVGGSNPPPGTILLFLIARDDYEVVPRLDLSALRVVVYHSP